MAKEVRVTCDRCGSDARNINKLFESSSPETMDICEECQKSFSTWLRSARVPKDKVVNVQVTEELKNTIKAASIEAGESISEYIRSATTNRLRGNR